MAEEILLLSVAGEGNNVDLKHHFAEKNWG